MAEAVSGSDPLPAARQGSNGGFDWKIAVAPADVALVPVETKARWALYRVAVTVSWGRNGRFVLETLKLGAKHAVTR